MFPGLLTNICNYQDLYMYTLFHLKFYTTSWDQHAHDVILTILDYTIQVCQHHDECHI